MQSKIFCLYVEADLSFQNILQQIYKFAAYKFFPFRRFLLLFFIRYMQIATYKPFLKTSRF